MAWQALISQAGERIAGHVRRTPVTGLDLGGRAVALKLEQMQPFWRTLPPLCSRSET